MKHAAAAILLGTLALPASADSLPDLLARAMKPAATTQLYAYEFLMRNEGGDRAGIVRGRIDPSRPEGERVTILEATGKRADPKRIKERMEKNADGDIWCDSLSNGVDGGAIDKGGTPAGRIFAFTPRPKADAKSDERKLYKQLSAEVAVDEASATIRTFSARLLKPWKPMVIAKLDQVEMKGECAPAPNGRAYRASMRTTMSGSAMGADFSNISTQTITNLRPVG